MTKSRKLVVVLSGALLVSVCGTLLLKDKEKSKAEELRESHAKFLKDHPYQKRSRLSKKERKKLGIPPNAYFEQKYLSEINPATGKTHKENVYDLQEKLASQNASRRSPGDGTDNDWEERGPNNVGGRTRAIIFDPNDATNETVFAGGVSGGLWRNTNISNANSEWELIGIPENISVSSIAVDPNNSNIFYVGTGESYTGGDANGNGLWKSIDGGNKWTKVFGGITGPSFFQANSTVTVSSPVSIAGDYGSILTTSFGGDLSTPLNGDIVLVNDGDGATEDGCQAITNNVSGSIAVIDRGSCSFTAKVLNAQNAGAIGVIMVNNVSTPPINMAGTNTTITIPAVMISKSDGNVLKTALSGGSTVNVTLTEEDVDVSGTILPGVQNINDILIRNNAGTSEVYVAVGHTYERRGALLGGDSAGVYKSTDGVNFTKLNLPKTTGGTEFDPNNIEVAADNSVLISTNSNSSSQGGGTILHSTDGVTFTSRAIITNGLRTEITLSSTNPNIGYALVQINDDDNPVKIFRTTDQFQNLTEVSLPNDVDTAIDASDFTRGQSSYDLVIKVDPSDDNTVFTGGIDLFRSTDGGSNWNQISKWSNNNDLAFLRVSLVHADQHGIAFANNDSSIMLFSNDGGVYYSSDSGTVIGGRKRNYNTLQFYTVGVAPTTAFTGGDYFLAGAQDNGTQLISLGTAGINSSTKAADGDGAYSFFDTDGTDRYYITNYVYNRDIELYNYDSDELISINRESTSNGNFINPEELDSNLDILYSNYSNASGSIIRRYANILDASAITKTNLTNALLDAAPSAMKVSPYTTGSSYLLAGLSNGKLLEISNANSAAISWRDITGSEFVGSISDVEFGRNQNEIFVTMHNYGVVSIWYTVDGGDSWLNKEGNFPDIPVKSILQNPLNHREVIIGTELGVWKTDDFGISSPNWVQSFNGMSNVTVTDMDLRDDNTIFVSTYGRGVFSGKFTVSATASVEEVTKGEEAFTVFPTVSKGEFTVFAKSEVGDMKMRIYNISGSEVYTSNLDFAKDENQKVSVNLSSGIYLVQMTDSNNKKSSKKIVIE
ncbi:PA domain-containing protein [Tenacibaculum sp. M341]|uniref:PA domain-containing protein n=1 Tax=Tenacibaculum sp. M341 TaxID=2530339 RepID=UPI00104766BF|nr:PA domain-containing protein [Tenacibaculum sp. M341]TCI84793.1 T9SS type A sorting domain-containing protein [Tenacibaculum sp. M341]